MSLSAPYMTLSENRIYLASRSPRRRELLKQIGVNFGTLLLREAAPRGADMAEVVLSGEAPADYTRRIAVAKAEMGRARLLERRLTELPVLAADTAVVLGERIFGKPENVADAKEMLRALSGQTHQVLTAVAVAAQNGIQVSMSRSVVRFRDISEHEIQCYLSVGEALDKAGGYAIQGMAAVFIAEISGSYSGVMGLPLFETAQLLQESGVEIFP
ncbi:Maf family protein [Nitrosospira briensis]|uniref:Maf family protein n=1 Tax=Nitrosospira briensis TaxID=35799 RepID=UPI000A59A6D1|nr:Maf family protein [Nitrosospira briensis]